MKKSILSIILISVLLVGLTGCSSNSEKKDNSSKEKQEITENVMCRSWIVFVCDFEPFAFLQEQSRVKHTGNIPTRFFGEPCRATFLAARKKGKISYKRNDFCRIFRRIDMLRAETRRIGDFLFIVRNKVQKIPCIKQKRIPNLIRAADK